MKVDEVLINNAQKTIDRLIRQLTEIDNEKDSLSEKEYKELREDTVNQLEEFGKIVERLQGGDVSLIDNLTATKIAIRAAISKAFKTPEVMALFAGKKTGLLREKLMMTENNYRAQKISKQEYLERKFEILMALRRLEEPLTEEEKKFLSERLETPEFQLIEANANRACAEVPRQEKRSLKRRAREEATDADDKMEVDDALPPKRKAAWGTENENEDDETVAKRIRIADFPVIPILPRVNALVPDAPAIQTVQKAHPKVSWASETHSFNLVPYKGCVVFDTNSLISEPCIIDDAIQNQVLVVIPCTVLSELDGLKKNAELQESISSVSRRIRALAEEKNCYLHMETRSELYMKLPGCNVNMADNDHQIIKCALRIKAELLSLKPWLNINEESIFFVSNDNNCASIANGLGVKTSSTEKFLNIIKGVEEKKISTPIPRRVSPEREAHRRDVREEKRHDRQSERRSEPRSEPHKERQYDSRDRPSSSYCRRSEATTTSTRSYSNEYAKEYGNDYDARKRCIVQQTRKDREMHDWIRKSLKNSAAREKKFEKNEKME
ncbi:unnamed protein product [Caenorhabditis sp. 36 PRJEB53466]|nr:unnamed protein product [Caenorhabditis sp. 36 PRJEB53466]